MFLPTSGLVHGRMLVSSWEHDLDGVDEDCIQLVLLASEVGLSDCSVAAVAIIVIIIIVVVAIVIIIIIIKY